MDEKQKGNIIYADVDYSTSVSQIEENMDKVCCSKKSAIMILVILIPMISEFVWLFSYLSFDLFQSIALTLISFFAIICISCTEVELKIWGLVLSFLCVYGGNVLYDYHDDYRHFEGITSEILQNAKEIEFDEISVGKLGMGANKSVSIETINESEKIVHINNEDYRWKKSVYLSKNDDGSTNAIIRE